MKSQHTIFPITVVYNNSTFATKALKYTYTNKEVLYKIALPSQIAPVQQFWVSKNDAQWKQIMGTDTDEILMKGIINAIETFEQIPMIQAADTAAIKELELKSA